MIPVVLGISAFSGKSQVENSFFCPSVKHFFLVWFDFFYFLGVLVCLFGFLFGFVCLFVLLCIVFFFCSYWLNW